MSWRRLGFRALIAIALALVIGRLTAGVLSDYLWFEAMGAARLWREKALAVLVLQGGAALLGTLFVFANLFAVRASILKLMLPRRVANLAFAEEVEPRLLTMAVALLSFGIGLLLVFAQGPWHAFTLARHLRPWGKADEYLERDLSFYMGWLPVERAWYQWSLVVLATTAVVVLLLYALSGSLHWRRGTIRLTRHARRHIFTLGALLLLMLAWGLRLDRYESLLELHGGAFGMLDHIPGLAATIVLSLLYVAAAVLVFWAGWTGQVRVAFGVVTTMIVTTLLLRHALPLLYGWTHPIASSQVRDRPYVETRNGYTRQAYALDSLILGKRTLPADSLESLADGVPSWEPLPLALAVRRSAARGDLVGTSGFVASPDGIRQLLVERRSDEESAGDPAGTWSVLTADPTRAGADGRLPFASVGSRMLPPVLVYEGASGYLVVLDSTGRLQAPSLGGNGRRLIHAWATQNLRLAFGNLPPHAKLLRARDVRARLAALVPFFESGDVSIGVHADSLYWISHLYAASTNYPLSRATVAMGREWSYFRYVATAYVNAHTGRVLIARGAGDPLSETWFRGFPELFDMWSDVPEQLVASTPPPMESAIVQARAFAEVGARVAPQPVGRLLWPTGGDSAVRGDEPPLMAAGDGVLQALLPILRVRDDRLAGVMVARGGARPGVHYEPVSDTTLRWYSASEALRALQSEAAARMSDGRIVAGAVRLVPAGDQLLFVNSFYTWGTGDPPRLAGVAVKQGSERALFATSAAAVLAGSATVSGDSLREWTAAEWRERARAAYDSARAALQRSDWNAFGEAYEELGRLLEWSPP